MKPYFKMLAVAGAVACAATASAQVTFFEHDSFQGGSFPPTSKWVTSTVQASTIAHRP